MSIRGDKFTRHPNYHVKDYKHAPNTTENYLINCFYCHNVFIASLLPNRKVGCVHCRKQNALMNPNRYSKLNRQWSDREIQQFNNRKPIYFKTKVNWNLDHINQYKSLYKKP